MRRPVDAPYTITTEFGVIDSYAKFGRHAGVDYAVPLNRPIYAPASGELLNVVSPTGGNMVTIYDGQFYHRLMHNESFSRGNGRVNEGDEVARCGTTGLSTGPHCHWDININGNTARSFADFRSPADWLAGSFVQTPSGGGDIMNADDVTNMYRVELGREPDEGGLRNYTGKSWHDVWYDMVGSGEWRERQANRDNETAALRSALNATQVALQNEQNKPPREVIKEVEKIVEVVKTVEVKIPVEVIKEVEPSWLTKIRDLINKFLKKG